MQGLQSVAGILRDRQAGQLRRRSARARPCDPSTLAKSVARLEASPGLQALSPHHPPGVPHARTASGSSSAASACWRNCKPWSPTPRTCVPNRPASCASTCRSSTARNPAAPACRLVNQHPALELDIRLIGCLCRHRTRTASMSQCGLASCSDSTLVARRFATPGAAAVRLPRVPGRAGHATPPGATGRPRCAGVALAEHGQGPSMAVPPEGRHGRFAAGVPRADQRRRRPGPGRPAEPGPGAIAGLFRGGRTRPRKAGRGAARVCGRRRCRSPSCIPARACCRSGCGWWWTRCWRSKAECVDSGPEWPIRGWP